MKWISESDFLRLVRSGGTRFKIRLTNSYSPHWEKTIATHSSTLVWEIPWTEEPGGLQSMGSRRVRHDWATSLSLFTFMHWRRKWHPTPVLLPGKSHGRRSLVGYSLWGLEESDTTEWLHFHFSLSCIGEGNGNPLQCSCLETPRDGGAWWAAVYGVTQSWTRLKQLSNSSIPSTISFILNSFKSKCLSFLRSVTSEIILRLPIIQVIHPWIHSHMLIL